MMRTIRIVVALVTFALVSMAGQAHALAGSIAMSVDVNVFHDALAPHGDWVQSERFGLVWTPGTVAHGWRPYTRGHWAYTDFGWTWVGDEEWSWATDHYGRWSFDPSHGWVWVPGAQWGPAWVAWRYGNGYVGWAPLTPEVGTDMARVNFDAVIDPFSFTFVNEHFLVAANLGPHIVPVARNVTYVQVTNNITNYTIVNNRVVNHGVEIDRFERAVGRPVPRVRVRDVETVEGVARGRARGADLAFYRPNVGPARPGWEPPGLASRSPRLPAESPTRYDLKEAQRLQRTEEHERQSLRKEQEREERNVPPGPSLDEMRQRHAAEMKAQDQHEQRERQMLEVRQQRQKGSDHKPPEKPKKH